MTRFSDPETAVSAVALPESVTLKVRLAVPAQAAFGVPEMRPAAVIFRHEGRVPLFTLKV
jgi:hypothetical protein